MRTAIAAFVSLALLSSPAAEGIILDNDPRLGYSSQAGTVTFSTGWQTSTSSSHYYDRNYHHNQSQAGRTVAYTPDFPESGHYLVEAWWTSHDNRANDAPYTIIYEGGTETIPVNQRSLGGSWNPLGVYSFAAGSGGSVEIASSPTESGYVIADALRFSSVELPDPYAEVTLPAFEDAHIRGGGSAGSNYGSESLLQLKFAGSADDPDFGVTRKTYMKFQLASGAVPLVGFDVPTELADAYLSFTFLDSDLGDDPDPAAVSEFGVYGILDDSWSEGGITWNNAPSNDTGSANGFDADAVLLGTFTLEGNGDGTAVEFQSQELIDFITANSVDDLLTFAIARNTPESDLGANYVHALASSEYNPPTLGPSLTLVPIDTYIPEPASLALLGLGGLLLSRRRGK